MYKSNTEPQGGGSLSLGGLAKNIGICYALTVAFIALFAVAVTFSSIPESVVPVTIFIITVISIALSGFLAARSARSKGWLCGALSGAAYVISLYLLGMLAFQSFTFGAGVVIMLCAGAGAGAVGGMFGVNARN